MQQTVAYALIADNDVGRIEKRHDPFDQIRAGENHIGSLRMQTRYLFALSVGHGLIELDLTANLVE